MLYKTILFPIFKVSVVLPLLTGCVAQENPNVIIILADDMGYGDISCNNPNAKTFTPNIDSLAAQGINFKDAHSAGSLSVPSRYALLTGKYFFRRSPQNNYMGYGSPLIENDCETIGTLLQKAGYITACIGKWHLGLEWALKDTEHDVTYGINNKGFSNINYYEPLKYNPQEAGFDYSFILPGSLDMPPYAFVRNDKVIDPEIIMVTDIYQKTTPKTIIEWDKKYTSENDVYKGRGVWWRNGEISASFRIENCLDIITEEGISFIHRQMYENPGKPFMLYLSLTGPHTPWVPGKEFEGMSKAGVYGDFVAHIDNVVCRINNTLIALGIENNTLLIFTSDNGAHWSENDILTYAHNSNYGSRGQKGDIWNGGHHIPLMIKWPERIKSNVICNQTVGLTDIIATLSELTGQKLQPASAEDSYSFYHVLLGSIHKPVRDQIIYISGSGRLAIQSGGWKYANFLGSGGFTDPSYIRPVDGGPEGQLYNLKIDPLEQNNLFQDEPDMVRKLSGMLEKQVKSKQDIIY